MRQTNYRDRDSKNAVNYCIHVCNHVILQRVLKRERVGGSEEGV